MGPHLTPWDPTPYDQVDKALVDGADEYLQLAPRVVRGLHVRLASSPPATMAQIPDCGIAIQEALTELKRLWDRMPPQGPILPTCAEGEPVDRDALPTPLEVVLPTPLLPEYPVGCRRCKVTIGEAYAPGGLCWNTPG